MYAIIDNLTFRIDNYFYIVVCCNYRFRASPKDQLVLLIPFGRRENAQLQTRKTTMLRTIWNQDGSVMSWWYEFLI